MQARTKTSIGWVLTVLVTLFLVGASGVPKFIDFPGKAEMFDKLGVTPKMGKALGCLEIALAVLFVIPRTSSFGAVLLTGYLGGATWAHVRIGDPYWFPIALGVIMWIGLGLRAPEIFALAIGKSKQTPN